MSEPLLKYPQWQKPYIDAMLETDPQILKSKICAAEVAIQKRIMNESTTPDSQEQQAISDALSNLRVLKTSEPKEAPLAQQAPSSLEALDRTSIDRPTAVRRAVKTPRGLDPWLL